MPIGGGTTPQYHQGGYQGMTNYGGPNPQYQTSARPSYNNTSSLPMSTTPSCSYDVAPQHGTYGQQPMNHAGFAPSVVGGGGMPFNQGARPHSNNPAMNEVTDDDEYPPHEPTSDELYGGTSAGSAMSRRNLSERANSKYHLNDKPGMMMYMVN